MLMNGERILKSHTTCLSLILKNIQKKYRKYLFFRRNQIEAVDCSALTEEIFEDFCKKLSQQLRIHKWKASNQIIFYLPWCDKLPNRSLKILASIITQYFPEVARITFNFAGCCEITDDGVRELFEGLRRKLPKLEQLECSLSGSIVPNQVSDKGSKILGSCLRNSAYNLKELKISLLDNESMTDKGILALCSKIASSLWNLEYLTISFCACEFITDESLKAMGYYFGKYLGNLKRLSLDFSDCTTITHKGLELMGLKFKNLANLGNLALNLSRCTSIKRPGLKVAIERIRKSLILL